MCANGNLRHLHRELLPKAFIDGHKKSDFDTLNHLLKTPIWQVKCYNFYQDFTSKTKNGLIICLQVPPNETFSHATLEQYIKKILGKSNSVQNTSNFPNGYLLLVRH